MAYSAHTRNDSHSSFFPRAPVSNSRHASPEAELEEHQQEAEIVSALSDGRATSSSLGETSGGPGSASIATANAGIYDGISPFFGSSGVGATSNRRFPSPYGTPAGTPTSGQFYPSLAGTSSLQSTGSRSPYPSYMQQQQQQAALNRIHHQAQYLQGLQQQSQNLHSPVIAPSYLQHQPTLPGSSMSDASGGHSIYATNGSVPVRSTSGIDQVLSGAMDSTLDDIEDDDEEEDGEEESSADEQSSFGEEAAMQEDVSISQGRKRGRKPRVNQVAKINGLSSSTNSAKRVKSEEGSYTGATKNNRKGKAKPDAAQNGEMDSKSKSTRGSKACTVCRRLKMRCEPAPDGDESKCKRCRAGGHDCVFEESQRGRRKNQKTDAMAKSIKNMESTLETVLKAIATGNAHTVAGMSLGSDGNLVAMTGGEQTHASATAPSNNTTPSFNLPPLPSIDPALSSSSHTSSAIASAPQQQGRDREHHASSAMSESYGRSAQGIFAIKTEEGLVGSNGHGASPALRLHSLPEPENTWAPLGLLAEASLENNQSKGRRGTFTASDLPHNLSALEEIRQARAQAGSGEKNAEGGKLGVANDAYFQPGPFNGEPAWVIRGDC